MQRYDLRQPLQDKERDVVGMDKGRVSKKNPNPNLLNPHQLQFKLYSKPTASFQYIHNTSHHPKSTKSSIIYGEALRILRNTSEIEQQQVSFLKVTTHFRNRGYPLSTINRMLTKAKNHTPILTCKPDQVFLKTRHDERRPALIAHLLKHKNKLKEDPRLTIINAKQTTVCKTNHPNIAKKVIRNALATDIQLNPIPTTNKI